MGRPFRVTASGLALNRTSISGLGIDYSVLRARVLCSTSAWPACTSAVARGIKGLGRLLLDALIGTASGRGYHKLIGLTTGGVELQPAGSWCVARGISRSRQHEKHGKIGGIGST